MKAQNRGIVIVSILVLTLLATFFLGALVQMNPSRLRRNVHDENRDRASMAARAGVDYVLNRFKSDTNWLADANMKTVEMEDLVVREDNGNVLGWIRAKDGSWAGFRVRFNAQDGDGGFDSRSNPNYPISNGALSLNNLDGPDKRAVPKATSSSVATGSTEPGDPNTAMVAPENSIALQVEGIVSPDLSPDDPSGLAEATDVTTRTIEGIYVISDIVAGDDGDAVLMAGADADIVVGSAGGGDLNGKLSLQSDSENVAGIRSKGEVSLTRGQGSDGPSKFAPDTDATVLTNPDTPFVETLADGTTFTGGEEDQDATFQKIEWDRVKNSEQSDAVTLPGGVYIFTQGDSDGGRSKSDNVKFFDMPWSQYKQELMDGDSATPVASAVPQSFLDMVELDAVDVSLTEQDGQVSDEKRDVIRVTGDVSIDDSKGNGLTIVPERGAKQMAAVDEQPSDELMTHTQFLSIPGTERVESSSTIMGALSLTTGLTALDVKPAAVDEGNPWDGTPINIIYDSNQPYGGGDFADQNGVPGLGANTVAQIALGGGTFNVSESLGQSLEQNNTLDGVQYIAQDRVVAGITIVDSYDIRVVDPVAFFASIGLTAPPPELYITVPGGAADPLYIPERHPVTGQIISLDPNATEADKTVPQDIEIVFDPADGKDSAFIRSETDIFLGTHLSGEGGGVISNDKVDLVGFGINIQARTDQNMDEQQERTGVAIYGKNGINISTYDERRNNYWDVEVKGAVFTEGNIFVRLGEDDLPSGENPPWGLLDYEGSMIALGNSNFVVTGGVNPGETEAPGLNGFIEGGDDDDGGPSPGYTWVSGGRGKVDMIARGVRLFYDPRYLAPYVEETTINPTFAALSVVER